MKVQRYLVVPLVVEWDENNKELKELCNLDQDELVNESDVIDLVVSELDYNVSIEQPGVKIHNTEILGLLDDDPT
jgi:hypothetical protein